MTLAAERARYTAWGWRDDLPDPTAPPLALDAVVSADPAIHDESEGCGVHQSLWLFRHTRSAVYFGRALAWAEYYGSTFLTSPQGLPGDDWCHVQGYGLPELAMLTGDAAHLNAAEAIAAPAERHWGTYDLATFWAGINLRGVARALLLFTALARSPRAARWRPVADRQADLMRRGFDPRGFYPFGKDWTVSVFGPDAAGRPATSVQQMATASWAIADYVALTGDADLRHQNQAISRWLWTLCQEFPDRLGAPHVIHDPLSVDEANGFPGHPDYAVCRIDGLLRGGFEEDAQRCWEVGSGGRPGRMLADRVMTAQPYYLEHNHGGDIDYARGIAAEQGWRWRLAKGTTQPIARGYSGQYPGPEETETEGGGHGGFEYNTVTKWLRAEEDWKDQFVGEKCDPAIEPKCDQILGGASVENLTPMGRLYVQHWYQKIAYWTKRKGYLHVAAANTALYQTPDTWTMLAGHNAPGNPFIPYGGDQSNALLLHEDPDLPDVMTFIVTSPPHAGMWRIGDDNRWVLTFAALPAEVAWHALYSTYVKAWKAHLVGAFNPDSGARSWWRVSAKSGSWLRVDGLDDLWFPAFAANQDGTRVVFVSTAGVRELNAETGAIAEMTVAGEAPNLRTDPDNLPNLWEDGGRFGFLEYGGQKDPQRTFILERGDAPIPQPPPGDDMKASYLGTFPGDIGPGTPTDPLPVANPPVPNWKIRVEGVPTPVQKVRVMGSPAGEWRSPAEGHFWGLRSAITGTTMELQGCVFQGVSNLRVAVNGGLLIPAAPLPVPPDPPTPPSGLTPEDALEQANAFTVKHVAEQLAKLKVVVG